MPGKERSLGKLESRGEAIAAAHTKDLSTAQLGHRGILSVACALIGAQQNTRCHLGCKPILQVQSLSLHAEKWLAG